MYIYTSSTALYHGKVVHFLEKYHKKSPFFTKKISKILNIKRRSEKGKIRLFLSRGSFEKNHFLYPIFLVKRKNQEKIEFSTGRSVDNVDKNPCKIEFSSISTEFSTGQIPSFPPRVLFRVYGAKKNKVWQKCTKSKCSSTFLHFFTGVFRRPRTSFLRGVYFIALCKKIYIYTFFKKALDNGKAPIYNKSNNKISH